MPSKDLITTILSIDSEKSMREFLQGILTPQEIVEINRRLKIVQMLKAGIAQREIAEKLEVGIATVSRGSREIKQGRFSMVK